METPSPDVQIKIEPSLPFAVDALPSRPQGNGIQTLMSRIPGGHELHRYISQSFHAFGGASQPNSVPTAQAVLCARFVRVSGFGRVTTLLLVGTDSGFQIWSLGDGCETECRELCSKACGAVRHLCLFNQPSNCKESPLLPSSSRVAAVLRGSSETAVDTVRIFSFNTHSFEESIPFQQKVLDVTGNSRVLLVRLKDEIHGFQASSLQALFHVSTFTCPPHSTAWALHKRWLAFPSSKFISSSVSSTSAELNMTETAQSVVTGLIWAGKKGTQAAGGLATQLNAKLSGVEPSEQHQQQLSKSAETTPEQKRQQELMKEVAGGIVILDVCTGSVVTQLRAHLEAIRTLAWSPSGDTLVTAPLSGQTLHLYRVDQSQNILGVNLILQYKLVRGLTPSLIESITVSDNSKWVSASTARGTTHVFAVNPQGGEVDGSRHVCKEKATRPDSEDSNQAHRVLDEGTGIISMAKSRNPRKRSPINLRSVAKIYTPHGRVDEGETEPKSWSPGDSGNHALHDTPAYLMQCQLLGNGLFIQAEDGYLSRYTLRASLQTRDSVDETVLSSSPHSEASTPSVSMSSSPASTPSSSWSNPSKLAQHFQQHRKGPFLTVSSDDDHWNLLGSDAELGLGAVHEVQLAQALDHWSSAGHSHATPPETDSWLTQIEVRTTSVVGAGTWASPAVTFSRLEPGVGHASPCDQSGWVTPLNPLYLEDRPSTALVVTRPDTTGSVRRPSSRTDNPGTGDLIDDFEDLQFEFNDFPQDSESPKQKSSDAKDPTWPQNTPVDAAYFSTPVEEA